jgi:hypothetical protein
MTKFDKTNKEYLEQKLSALHGATVIDTYVEIDDFDGMAWPGLIFQLKDSKGTTFYDSVIVSQDMEGNGPGVLLGLENIVELVGSEI